MKFYVELRCECDTPFDDCVNHEPTSTPPTGVFEDMRIGRAILEREAKERGWIKFVPIRKHTPVMWCPSCYNRLQPKGRRV